MTTEQMSKCIEEIQNAMQLTIQGILQANKDRQPDNDNPTILSPLSNHE